MHGRGGPSGSLTDALEFEGRFMSNPPITDNSMWWNHDQNPVQQQLADFIPIGNDAVPLLFNSMGPNECNTERLKISESSSRSMDTQSGYSDRLVENERISSGNINAKAVSGSSNHECQSNSNASNSYLIRPVVVQNLRSSNSVHSGRSNIEHLPKSSSSAQPRIELGQTNSLFRVENNAEAGPQSALVTGCTSEKRKLPGVSWDVTSASARKRSIQVSGSSGLQAAPQCHIPDSPLRVSPSSANIGVGSSGSVQSGAIPLAVNSLYESPDSELARRSQRIQQNIQIQNTQIWQDTSLQSSVPAHSALSGIDIRHNSYQAVQRPHLVIPPRPPSNLQNLSMPVAQHPSMVHPPSLSAVGSSNEQNHSMSVTQSPHMVLPPPQTVGESANSQNYPMTIDFPATAQQSFQSTRHRSAPSYALALGTIQVQEVRSRNSNQSIQFPAIAPPVGVRNLRQNPTNLVSSGAVTVAPVNASSGLTSDPVPSGPRPIPNLVSNGARRHRMEQFRQTLLAVRSMRGTSNPTPREMRLQSGVTGQGTQTMNQGATLTYVHNHSNFGAPGKNASTGSYDAPFSQMLRSQREHMIALYRGGRDNQASDVRFDVANLRQSSLFAWAMHDQHRDMRLDVDNMSYEELLELGDRIGNVKTGLSEETIMKCMKHYKYTAMMNSNKPDAEPCSICQEHYAEGEDLGALECGHEYHTNCIKQWLVQKNSCPICKTAASSSK